MKDKKNKNKKPLLQQVSTKKEKVPGSSKLSYLANPLGRLPTNKLVNSSEQPILAPF